MRSLIIPLIALGLAGTPAAALEVVTTASEDFQEKLEDDYGVRELAFLQAKVEKSVTAAFEDSSAAPAMVKVELIDARPNRPTHEQLSDNPSLSFGSSFSTGGAKLAGAAYNAAGEEIGSLEYKWYENDIRQAVGRSTWTDANRAIRRFATKLSKQVATSTSAPESS